MGRKKKKKENMGRKNMLQPSVYKSPLEKQMLSPVTFKRQVKSRLQNVNVSKAVSCLYNVSAEDFFSYLSCGLSIKPKYLTEFFFTDCICSVNFVPQDKDWHVGYCLICH